LIIIALGAVSYDFISKYKDFTEGAALIAKHIQSAITYVTRNFLERERRLPTANISVEVHELSPLKLLRKQCPTCKNPELRRGTGIVVVIAWYLVIAVLENTEWYTGLLVAIGSIPAAIWLHSEWKKVEQQVKYASVCYEIS
jgi:hypothetical protein